MARAEERRNRLSDPFHTCAQCEGRTLPAANERLRCPVIRIDEQRDESLRKALQEARYWQGEFQMRALITDYERVAGVLNSDGGEFNPRRPFRVANHSRIILNARAAAAYEADRDRDMAAKREQKAKEMVKALTNG